MRVASISRLRRSLATAVAAVVLTTGVINVTVLGTAAPAHALVTACDQYLIDSTNAFSWGLAYERVGQSWLADYWYAVSDNLWWEYVNC